MRTETHRRKAGGFTLVELAIVLVIIGLIVGGVLVGQDLIKAAGLRAQMKQVDEMNAAILAFKLKYACLPGDCANATNYFTAGSQPDKVTNGDGDGLIRGGLPASNNVYDWTSGYVDYKKVFDHLAAAGMYSIATYDETSLSNAHPGLGFPLCAYQPEGTLYGGDDQCGVIISYEVNNHYFRIGATGVTGGWNLSMGAGMAPPTAMQFDTKFDDGNGLTGGIRVGPNNVYQPDDVAHPNYGAVGSNSWEYAQKCVWTTGLYYTQGTVRTCSMKVKAGF